MDISRTLRKIADRLEDEKPKRPAGRPKIPQPCHNPACRVMCESGEAAGSHCKGWRKRGRPRKAAPVQDMEAA